MRFETKINGETRTLDCELNATLFEVLRNAGYKSIKQGCDREGTCGACTILLDGEAVLSCITPAPKAAGREITMVEALGHPAAPHPLQQAFVDAGAVQCGYCTPGMILAAKALLDRVPMPNEAQIADALSGNLCRCTGYVKITEAVQNAAVVIERLRPVGLRAIAGGQEPGGCVIAGGQEPGGCVIAGGQEPGGGVITAKNGGHP